MRKSSLFLLCVTIQFFLLGCLFTHASFVREASERHLQEKAGLVRGLGLTDLCLFTEASYTRHLSLADFHTAFQDSPMALEHFPSGSLVSRPAAAKKSYENVD
ncbi:MAG: hypothetical protein MUC98_14210 [Desulfobacterota bacterium]|jgi:hypothetical protein|nr:hypothetical protein [Thermodesulfobacteriota bacterium]